MNNNPKYYDFDIYDVVLFEDENGLTQDCVCAMGLHEEANEKIRYVECNLHQISFYKDGSYKVCYRDGIHLPFYSTNEVIKKVYTLIDHKFIEIYPQVRVD